jgi:hypothetical protein
MNKLFSRTSVTVDEAVAILLGWTKGPVEYRVMSEDPSPEELDSLDTLVFSLREYLQEELDKLESDLAEARADNMPAKIIAEKQTAIQVHDAVIEQAKAYLCAMHDEINKGDRSELHVDTKLSNTAYTYITLSSFDVWAKQYGRTFLAELQKATGTTLPAIQLQPTVAAKQKPRMRMREQEAAILETIRKFGYDPQRLPKNDEGKSGVKARVCDALKASPLFEAKTAFNKAWDRLRANKEIIGM